MAGKRGNPNWTKGMQSPNPGGRSAAATALRQALESLSEDAGNALRELLKSEDERVRLDATKFVVDHIKGKAPQAITGDEGGPLNVGVVILPAEKDE